eukprot:gene1439-835_t
MCLPVDSLTSTICLRYFYYGMTAASRHLPVKEQQPQEGKKKNVCMCVMEVLEELSDAVFVVNALHASVYGSKEQTFFATNNLFFRTTTQNVKSKTNMDIMMDGITYRNMKYEIGGPPVEETKRGNQQKIKCVMTKGKNTSHIELLYF